MSGEMMINTVKLEFPPGSPRPSWFEIAGFIKNLDTDLTNMEAVYKMGKDRSLCIKFHSEAAMQEALRRNQDAINFIYSSGKSVELRMFPAGIVLQYVRVFDVPPEVADNELCAALGKFGKIQRTVREKFPMELGLGHMFNGVRGLYMEIANEIPPALNIGKWEAKIYYDGLKEKCFMCKSEGHKRSSCPTITNQEKRNQIKPHGTTFAGVVEAGAAALPNEADVIEELNEIPEKEVAEKQIHTEEVEEAAPVPNTLAAEIEEEMDEEQLRAIDEAAEQLGLENFRENIAEISKLIEQYPTPKSSKDQASQRRAQFAASGSVTSTGLRPTKSARKSKK